MITTQLSNKPLAEQDVQALAIFCTENDIEKNTTIKDFEKNFYSPLSKLIKERNFTGKYGSSLIVAGNRNNNPIYLMLFGLGNPAQSPDSHKKEHYRRAVGILMRSTEQLKLKTLALLLPHQDATASNPALQIQETVSTAIIAHYHFDEFLTESSRKSTPLTITICGVTASKEDEQARARGQHIGTAVNQARHWCDLPGNQLSPKDMASNAEQLAKKHGLKHTIFGKEEISKMGMGGIIAVSQGSAQSPYLLVLEYKTNKPNAPTIALVGKGVTFDSGGLSIKPAAAMETMKDDMAGAAVVLSTIGLLSHFKPDVNIVALAPMVENMPSGTATRPGDIIKFYNGVTAEVRNTDAEGRLILADALAYAVATYKPDAMIDVATLTGACSAALGPFYCGLMTKDEALSEKLIQASDRTGDRVWPLPLDDDFKPAVYGDVADIKNIGDDKFRAGAITAAFFLQYFVGTTPWAHLDVAGTAFNVPNVTYYRPGATGFGVRLLTDLIMNWK